MDPTSYSRPNGFDDFDVDSTVRRKTIETDLLDLFRRYGYGQITLPTVEYSDLYSPQSIGRDLFHRLLSARIAESALFPTAEMEGSDEDDPLQGHHISEVVLRPEFTAPVARWFVSRLMAQGKTEYLPARVSYAGQVFRDVDPAPEHLKEFRQVGVELIGGDRAWGDAEILCLACDAATELKLDPWKLHMGHARLYRKILETYGLTGENLLEVAKNMEVAAGVALKAKTETEDEIFLRYVRDFLRAHRSRFDAEKNPEVEEQETWTAEQWRKNLPALHDDYLRRLWKKPELGLREDVVVELLELARLAGEPEEFFSQLERFLRDDEVKRLASELQQLCDDLQREQKVTPLLTSAASRGLAYYTGLTFEIHCPVGKSPHTDVCGGGRYDHLQSWIYRRILETQELRGKGVRTPLADHELLLNGVGLAFNLGRLVDALAETAPSPRSGVEVFVAVLGGELAGEAFRFAGRLRAGDSGKERRRIPTWCHLAPPNSGISKEEQMAHARRLGVRFTVVFDSDTWQQGQVALHDMGSDQESFVTAEAALAEITAERSEP